MTVTAETASPWSFSSEGFFRTCILQTVEDGAVSDMYKLGV